jgi:hypothetical protein
MRKYGLENFSFEIIEECSKEDLDSRERYWIKKFDSYYNGYNQTSGGQNSGASISLQPSDVLEIIELLKTTTLGNQEIAKEYNVSENTICGINTGYYWFQDDIDYPIRKLHRHVCQKCGKAIKNTAKYLFHVKIFLTFAQSAKGQPISIINKKSFQNDNL